MNEHEESTSEPGKTEDIAALAILGVFLIVLGCTMVVAAFWPPTWAGRLTNLLAAVLLLGIGGLMCLLGRSERRAHPSPHEQIAATDHSPPPSNETKPT